MMCSLLAKLGASMLFEERVKALSQKARTQSSALLTEEAAKTALVMPFINMLGYDVFDPAQVIPEFIADVGVKKGEKVDYAIKRNGEIIILVECKPATVLLDSTHLSQLFRYFSVTAARFAILTNGTTYQFYTDLDERNKLDVRPFLTFDILDPKAALVAEVKKFSKELFDVEAILSTALSLKYMAALKTQIVKEFDAPSEPLVRVFAPTVLGNGRITGSIKENLANLLRGAFRELVSEQVTHRLSTALASTEAEERRDSIAAVTGTPTAAVAEDVTTTDEEKEAYFLIKAIVRKTISADRIVMRDQKSYCGILVDNNNRRPLARLHLNRSTKYLGLFDGEAEERVKIESIDQIYDYSERLLATAIRYGKVDAGA